MSRILAAILVCGSVAAGKETLLVKENPNHSNHKRPEVQEYDCRTCLIENEDSSVCATYGSSMTVGWEWSQEWYDDPTTIDVKDGWYQLGLEIYSS